MGSEQAESLRHAEALRKAIENLINVKLHDVLTRPGGLQRLAGQMNTGVASFAVRNAERQLDETLEQILAAGQAMRGEATNVDRAPRRRAAAAARVQMTGAA